MLASPWNSHGVVAAFNNLISLRPWTDWGSPKIDALTEEYFVVF